MPVTLGEKLREARQSLGLSLEEVTFRLRAGLPERDWPKIMTIQRIETGATPADKVPLILLKAMANVYGLPIEDLDPGAAIDLTKYEDVLRAKGEDSPKSAGNAGYVTLQVLTGQGSSDFSRDYVDLAAAEKEAVG